jgi:hypothetical protein
MPDEQAAFRNKLEEVMGELRTRDHDRLYTILEKSEESTLRSAENAIRIILLINGGAAASVLAFAGSLASRDRVTIDQLSAIAGSLVWFACGVASAALTAFFSYLSNLLYLFATMAQSRRLAFPYVEPTPKSVRRFRIGRIFHCLALLAALGSLALFLVGMYEVENAIRHLEPASKAAGLFDNQLPGAGGTER